MKDALEHKHRFEAMLLSRRYSDLRAFIVEFEGIPDILCSGAHFPQFDFAGHRLQDLNDESKKAFLMTFSLIASRQTGAFIFAWDKSGEDACHALALSLDNLSDEELSHAIVRFVFEFCENKYMRIDWWDALRKQDKDRLTQRLQVSFSPSERRSNLCLADDGIRAVSWKVKGRTWL